MPLLDIRHLTIEIDTPQGMVKAVDRMSLTINEGEIRGLVGESGSGKSLVAKAICGVTKDNWRVSADRLRLGNVDLLSLSPRERRKIVGREIAWYFRSQVPVLTLLKQWAASWRKPFHPIRFPVTGGSALTGASSNPLLCFIRSVLKTING